MALAEMLEDSDSDENEDIENYGANFYNSIDSDRCFEILGGISSVADIVVERLLTCVDTHKK